MANGDAAAAAGMDVVNGNTQDIRLAYDEENKGRDYLANHITTGGHLLTNMSGVLPVAKGGTGATTPAAARAALQIAANLIPTTGSNVQADIDFLNGKIDAKPNDGSTWHGSVDTDGSARFRYARNNPVASSYVALYVDGNGIFGPSPSAERFKQDIAPREYTLDDIRRIVVVVYRLRAAVADLGDGAPFEVGIIAEQLEAAGFPEFIVRNQIGEILTIDYARLVVVAIQGVQQLADRYDALAERVAALEEAR